MYTYNPIAAHLGIYPRVYEYICSNKYLHTKLHSSSIPSNSEPETSQMSFNRGMVKRTCVCVSWNDPLQYRNKPWYTQQYERICSKELIPKGFLVYNSTDITLLKWQIHRNGEHIFIARGEKLEWGRGVKVEKEGCKFDYKRATWGMLVLM